MEDFYDPKKQKARGYDPSKDASVAASIQKRIQKEQALHGMQDKNIKVATVNAKEENQTQAYKKSRIQAEKKFEEQRAKLNGVEKGKLTRQREQWIAAETANIEEQRKAANREKARLRKEGTSKTPAKKPGFGSRVGGAMSRLGGRVSMGGIGMAGMVAGGAMSAMSMMGGPMGDMAGQIGGPLMAISGLASVLGMIPGPAGLVVAGLAGVAGIAIATKMAFDNANKEAINFTNSIGSGTRAIESLAAATGNVTAGQTLQGQREASIAAMQGVSPERATFGKEYLESESGKSMYESIAKRIKDDELNLAEISDDIYQQLSTAVVSGAIDSVDAKSIALALGDKLENQQFSATINAKLDRLLGPNGENIEDSVFEVAVTISEESTASFNRSMSQISLDIDAVNDGWVWPWEEAERLGKATGEFVATGATRLQQQQELLDALELEYQERLRIAQASGDQNKIESVNSSYQEKRNELIKDQKQTVSALVSEYQRQEDIMNNALSDESRDTAKKVREAMMQSLDTQIQKTYENDPAQAALAATASQTIQGSEATQDQEFELKFLLSTGDIPPETVNNLMKSIGGDQEDVEIALDVVSNLGTAEGGQVWEMANMIKDGDQKVDFLTEFSASTPAEAKELYDFYARVSEFGGTQALNVILNSEEKGDNIQESFDKIDDLFASGEPVTYTQILEQEIITDAAGMQFMTDNAEWFNSLPAAQQRAFVSRYLTVFETVSPQQLTSYLNENAAAAGRGGTRLRRGGQMTYSADDYAWARTQYSIQQGQELVNQLNNALGSTGPMDRGPSGGGGGGGAAPKEPEKPPTSFLDSIVKDMRQFTTATQGLTENFVDSMNAIRSSSASAFGGLSQQLRRVGIGEDVISLMTGMSKEEWDQYKGQFFNFDAAGNITGFKSDLTSIAEKLRAITLGKFVDEQQKSISNTANQALGLSKLVSLGMSYANAYEMVEDAALAAAIANAKSADEIRQIIELANQARQIQSLADASKSVAGTNDATDATLAGLNALIKYNSALSDTQISAILASDELQTMLANFDTLDVSQLEVLNEALQDAANKEALEIQIKMQTPEGMQDLFNEGFGKAMEQFSAREQEIKIKFTALKDPFQDVIKSFSQQIEDMKEAPGGLDDLEADLQRIGEQEIDINKKYDERFKALDSIAKVNERIAAQQRTQLSLSEALSMGDIAAAARVAQEMRATDAAQALVDQREALQKSQELELENLMGNMGMTRAQLEAQIRDIKQQIFEIEEAQIEPAQRQIDLLTRQEELELSSLTILGQTRDEWEAIKNQVELARTSSDSYAKDIERADGLVQQLINKWNEVPSQVTTIHTIIEDRITAIQNTPPPPPPAPAPAPVASTAPAPAYNPANDPAWVNSMAIRTIRGEFGNGQARRNALGANYDVIQNRVNQHYAGTRLFAKGGYVASYMANGGMTKPLFGKKGTDTVPAMLTPGEFVIKKWAVDKFGVGNLNAINQGNFGSGSVYNYNMSVNVRSDANPDEIARTVMAQIKRVDAQRIRGNRF
jgi:hypothetical protein